MTEHDDPVATYWSGLGFEVNGNGKEHEVADSDQPAGCVALDGVVNAACRHFQLTAEELLSPSRRAHLVYARQVAMRVARSLTGASLPAIGAHFRRDHSTVVSALSRIQGLEAEGGVVCHDLATVTALAQGGRPVPQGLAAETEAISQVASAVAHLPADTVQRVLAYVAAHFDEKGENR